MAQRLRETIERSLGALLVSHRVRNNPGACPDLSVILAGWDGQFTVLTPPPTSTKPQPVTTTPPPQTTKPTRPTVLRPPTGTKPPVTTQAPIF